MTTNPQKRVEIPFFGYLTHYTNSPFPPNRLIYFFPLQFCHISTRDKRQCLFQNMSNKSARWIPEMHLDIAVTNNTEQLMISHSLGTREKNNAALQTGR